jgi:hypothetical protein
VARVTKRCVTKQHLQFGINICLCVYETEKAKKETTQDFLFLSIGLLCTTIYTRNSWKYIIAIVSNDKNKRLN